MYVGDVGTVILIDMQEDISAATIHTIKVRKDGGDSVWAASIYNSNYLRYIVVADDFNEAGTYYLQPYLEFTGWQGLGETITIEIYDSYK